MNPCATPSPVLWVSTFGPLSIHWNGEPIARLGSGKAAALLVYLAVERGMHRRETLADLFYPDLPSAAARLNLRQLVFQLRSVLMQASGQAFLVSGRYDLGFAEDCPLNVSAAAFAVPLPDCASASPDACPACLTRMAAQIDLYQGPFMADFSLPDCQDFEDWLNRRRESSRRRALDLLARLSDCHGHSGHARAALPFALRYVELEPWSEVGRLRAMRLYAQDGQPDAALAQYESCRLGMEHELGVAPHAQMQAFAHALRAGTAQAVSTLGTLPLPDRRQLTVLYCELQALDGIDPEDAVALLRAPQARCEEIVCYHGGHVVHTYNGGLLAYFGYPLAQENAPVYAVRAALALAAESAPQWAVGVGVHSGLVLTAPETGAPDAAGVVSGIALRLHALADAGEVIVSGATQQRTAGYFRCAPVGERRRAGLPQGMELFRVVGDSGATHRLAAAERLTPFSGRDNELAVLMQAWTRARGGVFQSLLLSGEAGIGKSRLVGVLSHWLDNGSGMVRELRCCPEAMQSPLHPVIAFFARLSGFQADDDGATRLAKLEQTLHELTAQLAPRALPLLAGLMGLTADAAPAQPVGPLPSAAQLQATTSELLADLMLALAAHHPVLLVAEDLHWADASTLDVLARLLTRRTDAPMLVLMTTRPQWQSPWPDVEVLTLAALADADVTTMVSALRPDITVAHQERIVALADGVPLFVEELVAMAQGGAPDQALPFNLQDLLMARLDALGTPARALAQVAATVGREFDRALLGRVSHLASHLLQQAAALLQGSGLVREMADRRLQFKHALVQEVAYQSQTRTARKAAHRRVAQTLETHYPLQGKDHPEMLAQHWTLAGDADRAVPLWLKAGRQAAGRFAHREAVAHFESGLGLLQGLAHGARRDGFEFDLLVGLAQSEQAVVGYGLGRSFELLSRATALLGHGGKDGVALFNVVWSLCVGAGSRAGHAQAVRLAQQLVEIAEAEKSVALLQQAHYLLGNTLFWTGELGAARTQLEIAVAMEAPDAPVPLRSNIGYCVMVCTKQYLSWVLWLQGFTDQAIARSEESLAQARRHADPGDLAFALFHAATLQRWLGNVDATLQLANEGCAQATQCHSAVFAAASGMTSGWAQVMQGHAQSIVLIEQTICAIRTAMNGVVVPLLGLFAHALLHLGDTAKAMPILDEALRMSDEKQDRFYLAELHRLKGDCQLLQGDADAARASFETALATAQTQGAVPFERWARQSLLGVDNSNEVQKFLRDNGLSEI